VWRTKKVRHGSITSGRIGRVAATGVGACRDLLRRDAQRCGEDRRCVELQIIREWASHFKAREHEGLLNGNTPGQRAKLNGSRRQSIIRTIEVVRPADLWRGAPVAGGGNTAEL